MPRIAAILVLALAAPLAAEAFAQSGAKPAEESSYRTWLIEVGELAVSAEFLGVEKGRVALRRRSDGSVLQVPLDHLSRYDREFVLQRVPPLLVSQPPDTKPAVEFDKKLAGSTAQIPVVCQPNHALGLKLSGKFCLRTMMVVKPEGGEAITARLTSEPREQAETQLLLAPIVVAGHKLGGVHTAHIYLIDADQRGKRDAAPISNVLKVPVDFGE